MAKNDDHAKHGFFRVSRGKLDKGAILGNNGLRILVASQRSCLSRFLMAADAYRPHVVLMIETATVYGRRILQGITRYLRAHRPWSVFLEQHALGADPPSWLRSWRGDGLIARTTNPALVDLAAELNLAAIDLNDRGTSSDRGMSPAWPRFVSDDVAIGRIAAEHLLERGFRSLAFCGYYGEMWSDVRKGGFVKRLVQAGLQAAEYASHWSGPQAIPWESEQTTIGRWLKQLPKPLGVFCANDIRGQQIIDAADRVGLSVPEQVAVIGVDDDKLRCDLCDPPLSSVVPNAVQIGYDAAEALDRQMKLTPQERARQRARQGTTTKVEPLGVNARQSTDTQALSDETVAAALSLIRQQACQGLTVTGLLEQLPEALSRTTLERRFRQALGRSPQSQIRDAQLVRVKQLLSETDLSLDRIAELSGFRHSEYLSFAFKRDVGETPGQFRKRVQMGMVAGALRIRDAAGK